MARAIKDLAECSSVPVISQAAVSVLKLLTLLDERREASEKAISLHLRCQKLAILLKEAESILQQVRSFEPSLSSMLRFGNQKQLKS